MKTPGAKTFKLASPGPGAYRVRLVGEDPQQVATATFAGADDVQTVRLPPGAYTANVEPIGSSAVTAQTVHLVAQRKPVPLHDDLDNGVAIELQMPKRSFGKAAAQAAELLAPPCVFSIGSSVDTDPGRQGGWVGRKPRLAMSVGPGSLALEIRRPSDWAQLPRWRLTIAVQGERLWRLPLPLFKGGVQVLVSPLLGADRSGLSIAIAPREPVRAALVASLDQFFDYSTARIATQGPTPPTTTEALDLLAEQMDDPWAAVAAALSIVRRDEVLSCADAILRLASRFEWLPDTLALKAWVLAWQDAMEDRPDAESEARCLENLRAVREVGVPYFAASESLAIELASGLTMSADPDLKLAAEQERDLWARRARRRQATGALLSWQDWRGRVSTGRLPAREYAVIASGLVSGEQLEAIPIPSRRKAAGKSPPALSRPVLVEDDDNKGRFGGKASADGFSIGARFDRGPEGWIEITLTVRGPADADGEEVQLFLHETFSPSRITRTFDKGVAVYTTLAYGGFTVGVWIPGRQVELELDLSLLPDAPLIIQRY